jgi:aryl-alcohol dehydrogenase-like predicted oxidoreductase
VDLWVMHRDDPSQPIGPIVEIMNEHLQAGRIHAYGGSNWTHRRIQEADDYAASRGLVGFAVSSPNFSLAERVRDPWGDSICIGGPQNEDARAWYQANRMPLVPWSSLAAGFFSGRYTRDILEGLPPDTDDHTVRWFYNEANTKRLDRCEELAKEKDCTVAQVALAYLLCGPLNVFPLVGCRSPKEMQADIAALDVKLTPADIAYLELNSDTR